MSRLSNRRLSPEIETDIDRVPVMNMFLVLIPFLLMSASFLHLKAINTSVPVQAEPAEALRSKEPIRVMVVVEILEDRLQLSPLAGEIDPAAPETLECELPLKDEQYPLEQLAAHLGNVKRSYPLSDTARVVPHGEVLYDTIIRTMDAARFLAGEPLVPNAVLSAKVG